MTSLSSTEQGVLSLPLLVEVKGQKAKEGGQRGPARVGWGWCPWLLGGSSATGRTAGRAGKGRGDRGLWPQAWVPDPALGAGRSAGALTGKWGRTAPGGEAVPRPHQAADRGGGLSRETGWSRGASGPWSPAAEGEAITARVPQEGHLPAACQRVTGAGLEFASGPTQVID